MEDLFGNSASVADAGHTPHTEVVAASQPSTASANAGHGRSKKTRMYKSDVRNNFQPILKVEEGEEVKYAIFHICKSELTATSIGGVGRLKRHTTTCKLKAECKNLS